MPIPFILPAAPAIGKALLWLAGGLGLGAAAKSMYDNPPKFSRPRFKSETYRPYNPPATSTKPVVTSANPTTKTFTNPSATQLRAQNEALNYYRTLSGKVPVVLNSLSPRPAMGNYVDLTDHPMNVLRYGYDSKVLPQITVTAPRPPLVLRSSRNKNGSNNNGSDDALNQRLSNIEGQMTLLGQLLTNSGNSNNNNNNNNKMPGWLRNGLIFGAGIAAEKGSDYLFPNTEQADSLSLREKTENAASQVTPVYMPSANFNNNANYSLDTIPNSSDSIPPVNRTNNSTYSNQNFDYSTFEW